MSDEPRFTIATQQAFLQELLDLNYFRAPGETGDYPLHYSFTPAKKPDCRLLVITGSNATGKSLVRRLIGVALAQHKMEVMRISMEARSGPDYSGGMRSFIYGDESRDATGVNSARTVTTGIKTCLGRQNPHAIIWDEPDLGLADEYAIDLGHRIAELATNPEAKTWLITVISHRRELLEPLLGTDLHHIHMGPEPYALKAWLKRKPQRRNIEELYEANLATFRAVLSKMQGNA